MCLTGCLSLRSHRVGNLPRPLPAAPSPPGPPLHRLLVGLGWNKRPCRERKQASPPGPSRTTGGSAVTGWVGPACVRLVVSHSALAPSWHRTMSRARCGAHCRLGGVTSRFAQVCTARAPGTPWVLICWPLAPFLVEIPRPVSKPAPPHSCTPTSLPLGRPESKCLENIQFCLSHFVQVLMLKRATVPHFPPAPPGPLAGGP